MDEYSVHSNWYQSTTVLGGQTTAGFQAPVSHNIAGKQRNLTELEARISKVLNEAAERWTERLMETYDRVFENFQQQLRQKIQISSEMAVEKEDMEVEFNNGGEEVNLKKEEVGDEFPNGGDEVNLKKGEEVEDLFPISGDEPDEEKQTKMMKSKLGELKTTGNRSCGGGDVADESIDDGGSGVTAGIYGGGHSWMKIKRRADEGQRGRSGSGGGPGVFLGNNLGNFAKNFDDAGQSSLPCCGNGGWGKFAVSTARTRSHSNHDAVTNFKRGNSGASGSGGGPGGSGGVWWGSTVVECWFLPGRSFEGLVVLEKGLEFSEKKKKLLVEATKGTLVIRSKKKDKLVGVGSDISNDITGMCKVVLEEIPCALVNRVRKGKFLVGNDGDFTEISVDVTITNLGAHSIYQNISLVNGGGKITCSEVPNLFSIHFCNPSFPLIPSFIKDGPMAKNFFSHPVYSCSPFSLNLISYFPYQFHSFSYHPTHFHYSSNQLHVNGLNPFTQSLPASLFQDFNVNQPNLFHLIKRRPPCYGDTSTYILQHKSFFAVENLGRILSSSLGVLYTSDKFLQCEWYLMGVAKSNDPSYSESYEKSMSTVQGKSQAFQRNSSLGRTNITLGGSHIIPFNTAYLDDDRSLAYFPYSTVTHPYFPFHLEDKVEFWAAGSRDDGGRRLDSKVDPQQKEFSGGDESVQGNSCAKGSNKLPGDSKGIRRGPTPRGILKKGPPGRLTNEIEDDLEWWSMLGETRNATRTYQTISLIQRQVTQRQVTRKMYGGCKLDSLAVQQLERATDMEKLVSMLIQTQNLVVYLVTKAISICYYSTIQLTAGTEPGFPNFTNPHGFSREKLQHKVLHGKGGENSYSQLNSKVKDQMKWHPIEGKDCSTHNKYLANKLYLVMKPTFNTSIPVDNLISGLLIPSSINVESDYYPP